MKTLLRLALVSLCGAAGIMLALRVAEFRPAETVAVAAANVPIVEPAAKSQADEPAGNAKPADDVKPAAALAQPKSETHEAAPAPTPMVVEVKLAVEDKTPKADRDEEAKPAAKIPAIRQPSAVNLPAAQMPPLPDWPQEEMPRPRTMAQFPSSANMPTGQSNGQPDLNAMMQMLGQMQQGQGGGTAGGFDPSVLLNMLGQQGAAGAGTPNVSGLGTAAQAEQLNTLMKMYQTVKQNQAAIAEAQSQLNGLNGPALGGPANNGLQAAPQPAPPVASNPPAEDLPPKPPAVETEGDGLLSIHSRDDDIRNLLEQLAEQSGLNLMASESVQGTVTVSLEKVGVEAALAAVLKATGFVSRREGNVVYIGTAADFAALEKSLDRIGTRVYRPNYLNAKELQTLLTPMLTPVVGKMGVTSPAATGIAANNTTAGGDSIAQSDAVVVQDYENVLLQIDQVFKELDRRPSQVSIEAVIIQVTLRDANSFGVDFQVLRDKQNVRFGWGNPRITPLDGAGTTNPATGGKVGEFTFDPGGLKFAFLDDSLGIFLNALETVGNVNVVASPKLLCLNKQKAEILIGSKLGYISTTMTQTFSSQNVEFLDVGTQLRLRPFISSDGLVRMEVHPELSTGAVTVEGGFTLPNKNLTEVTTNVMCPDGCTVIIGGLMREDLATDSTQVPWFGSAPLIGPLFRNKSDTVTRTEILVLLTPRIINDEGAAAEGAQFARDAKQMEATQFKSLIKLGTAKLSRENLVGAQQAWAKGNRFLARRLAKLAVQHDPLNRDAVRFLNEISGNNAPLAAPPIPLEVEATVSDEPLVPQPAGGEAIPPAAGNTVYPPDATAVPMYPQDPGIPGREVHIQRPEVFRNDKS